MDAKFLAKQHDEDEVAHYNIYDFLPQNNKMQPMAGKNGQRTI